ncbi:hypothetical protein J43TS9_38070 [Paenibacillus cineris]|nr:hypothetical protein J43TS9_38070 [Paenibacillus cineris]
MGCSGKQLHWCSGRQHVSSLYEEGDVSAKESQACMRLHMPCLANEASWLVLPNAVDF